jgi:hypothetical protein
MPLNNIKASYKPDSVIDGHLSGPIITNRFWRATFHPPSLKLRRTSPLLKICLEGLPSEALAKEGLLLLRAGFTTTAGHPAARVVAFYLENKKHQLTFHLFPVRRKTPFTG